MVDCSGLRSIIWSFFHRVADIFQHVLRVRDGARSLVKDVALLPCSVFRGPMKKIDVEVCKRILDDIRPPLRFKRMMFSDRTLLYD